MGDSIIYCEQCENRVGCHLARKCYHAKEQANSPLDATAGSPILGIESAVLNIGTAISDCESARTAWVYDNWNDCTMWISNAIAQLEAARSKIYAHQETENSDYPHHST